MCVREMAVRAGKYTDCVQGPSTWGTKTSDMSEVPAMSKHASGACCQ